MSGRRDFNFYRRSPITHEEPQPSVKQQIAKWLPKKASPQKKPRIEGERTTCDDHMLINSESTSSLVKFGGKQNFLPLSYIMVEPMPLNVLDKSSTLKIPDTHKIEPIEKVGII